MKESITRAELARGFECLAARITQLVQDGVLQAVGGRLNRTEALHAIVHGLLSGGG